MQIKFLVHNLQSKTVLIKSRLKPWNTIKVAYIHPSTNTLQNPHLLSSIHNHEEDRIEERLYPKHQHKLRADIGEHSQSRLTDKTDDDEQSEE